MKGRRVNQLTHSLPEELRAQAGTAGIMGGFSEVPASYLECPGGPCREQEEPKRGADDGPA